MKKVLFVCMSNMRRSKMAAEIFTKLSGTKAESAGIEPAAKPDKDVLTVLKELDITVDDPQPKKLTTAMLEEADRIITFNCADKLPKGYESKTENWDVGSKRGLGTKPPEKSLDELRELRDAIGTKVRELIERLREE